MTEFGYLFVGLIIDIQHPIEMIHFVFYQTGRALRYQNFCYIPGHNTSFLFIYSPVQDRRE